MRLEIVLSCEEMTYTEGGATVGQAVAAWLWPGYATVIGINTCREAKIIFPEGEAKAKA